MPNLKLIHNLQPNTAIGDISIDMTKSNPIIVMGPYGIPVVHNRPTVEEDGFEDDYEDYFKESDQVKAIAMIMDIQSRMATVEAQLASILKILGDK